MNLGVRICEFLNYIMIQMLEGTCLMGGIGSKESGTQNTERKRKGGRGEYGEGRKGDGSRKK